jgi:hypothetical protein
VADRLEQRSRLRPRGSASRHRRGYPRGRDSVDKLRAQRTARAWSLDGVPHLGVSVFAVPRPSVSSLLRDRFANFRAIHLTTVGVVRAAGFGALIVAGEKDGAAVCQVIDLAPAGDGTIVHLRLLPGLVEDCLALAHRLAG